MKLLLTGVIDYTNSQLDILENMGFDIKFLQYESQKIDFDVSQIEAIVCNGLFLYNDIKKFTSLKHIQLTSAGLDRVPLDYIREKKINLYNAKDIYSIPIAEWAILKILEIYKSSNFFRKNQENKVWEKKRDLLELTDKVVTIVGCGSVGLEVAKRLKAFGTIVYGVGRRNIESPYIDYSFILNELDDLLKKSDIVILSIALTEETKYLFNKYRFNLMKDDAVLVNVSRGAVIKEDDLEEAVEKGKFMGVAIDVMEYEPLPRVSKLWDNSRVIVTPHNSFVSDKCKERLFRIICNNLCSLKEGEMVDVCEN